MNSNTLFSKKTIENRQINVAAAWQDLLSSQDCVLVFAGDPITKPGGLDQNYPFLPHPSYFWLTGHRLPSGVAVYNKDLGWTVFIKPLSKAELIWEGDSDFTEVGTPVSELKIFLAKHNFKKVIILGQAPKTAEYPASDEKITFVIKAAMDQVRRVKDEEEVALVRKVAGIAHFGYKKMRSVLTAGLSERELQVEYEAEIFRRGAQGVPYTTLVGSGVNAAILHSLPTAKKMNAGEWVLVDAGAEIYDYCVDITRVFAVDGKFTQQQKSIYD